MPLFLSERVAAVALTASLLAAPDRTRLESHREEQGRIAADGNSAYVNPAEVPHAPPPQPSGPQVGKSDSLLNAAAARLRPWVKMWRTALPGFSVDSLYRAETAPALRGYIQPLKAYYPPDEEEAGTFSVLSAESPDGRYKLIVDRDQYVEEVGTEIRIGGEPDSAPLLLDMRSGTANGFESCGTGCGFHWGTWLSRTSFVLGGWQDADDYGQWKQGQLSIYSVADSTKTIYMTRIISAKKFDTYWAAWEASVAARYRALHISGAHPSRPSSTSR